MSIGDMSDEELRSILLNMEAIGDAERIVGVDGKEAWRLTERGMSKAADLIKSSPSAREFAARLTAAKLLNDAKKEGA